MVMYELHIIPEVDTNFLAGGSSDPTDVGLGHRLIVCDMADTGS